MDVRKKLTYKLSDMTIETKYNLGDEVWFYHHKNIIRSRVRSITLLVRKDSISATYLMEDMWTDQYIVLNEDELFPTKEELLKSL